MNEKELAEAIEAAREAGKAEEQTRIIKIVEGEQLEWRAFTQQDQICERILRRIKGTGLWTEE